jgi:hypothetical protein
MASPTVTNYSSVMPGAPAGISFTSANDANGNLLPQYQSTLNTQGLDQARTQALSNNFTPWQTMAMQNAQSQGQVDLGTAQKQIAQQNMQGMRANPNTMGAINAIKNAGSTYVANTKNTQNNVQQMRLQGQQSQVANLGTQASNDVNALQPQEFNISNALDQKTQQDTASMNNYQQQMQAWGAAQQAKAQVNAGKK